MVKRKFIIYFECIVANFILLPVMLHAQKDFNILEWKADVSLNTYLVQKMKQQYADRSRVFMHALESREATSQYINNIRLKRQQLFTSYNKKMKLNSRITGMVQMNTYSIQKLVYESFPGHHVTANLYIPNGKSVFPAVLLFCGHEDVAKATESYQKTAILFATNGFVVLVIDPLSQGERYQLTDKAGKPLTRGGTTEHTLLNAASNLFGQSTASDQWLDNVRGLDYLVTRKEVDTTRIGCIGNSGGAMQTIFFAGSDSRIKVAAACSFLMNRERSLELTGPSDGCSHIPNEGMLGLEMSDYLIAAAPTPLLVLAGRYDFIDYNGTIEAYREIEKVYTSLGYNQKIRLFTYDDGHGISQPKREAAVTWFRKWLYGDSTEIHETVANTFSDKELMVTSNGQVVRDYPKQISIPARNLKLYKTASAARKKFTKSNNQQLTRDIRQLLAVEPIQKPITVEEKGRVTSNQITFQKKILRKEGEIPLPALLILPEITSKKVIIWLDEAGKNKLADSSFFIRAHLQKQHALVLADIRGMGETEDKADLNDPKYFNKEYRNAMLALHIGKPLVGQRVTDILTILQFIESEPALRGLPVELHASGAASLPGLHAALFNKNIVALNLYNAPGSYLEMLEHPSAKNLYSYVIPGVLNYYDLPDLIRLIGSKKITFTQQASETKTW